MKVAQNDQEAHHESSHLRTGFDPQTNGKPDD
jgi:hypothetical protein